MSSSDKSIEFSMLCEDNINFITETIYELCVLCEKKRVFLSREYVQNCIDDILVFYEQYLKTLKSKFLDVDFYKIVSWFAVFMGTRVYKFNKNKNLMHNTNWANIVAVCVWYMVDQLENEGKVMPKGYLEKIVFMVLNEIKEESNLNKCNDVNTNQGNLSDFGIGKNGLYMLMKLMSVVEVKSD